MKTNTEKSNPPAPEIVGRKFHREWFQVGSRLVEGSDGRFYGASKYATREEAQAAIDKMGQRYTNVGGITLDTGVPSDLCEYRITKVVADFEVLHTEFKKV